MNTYFLHRRQKRRRKGRKLSFVEEKIQNRKIFGEKKYCFIGEEKEVKIFGEGKYFLRRRKKTEKEKEENIWRSKILFLHRE